MHFYYCSGHLNTKKCQRISSWLSAVQIRFTCRIVIPKGFEKLSWRHFFGIIASHTSFSTSIFSICFRFARLRLNIRYFMSLLIWNFFIYFFNEFLTNFEIIPKFSPLNSRFKIWFKQILLNPYLLFCSWYSEWLLRKTVKNKSRNSKNM